MPYLISILEFAIFLTSLQYLIGEATILDRLRVKLPSLAQQMISCPSCFGFWLGVIAGPLGLGPWGTDRPWWSAAGISGLAAIVLVPIFRGLVALGWAVSGAGQHDEHSHAEHEDHEAHEHPDLEHGMKTTQGGTQVWTHPAQNGPVERVV